MNIPCFYVIIYSKTSAKIYYHAEDDFLAFSGRMGHKLLMGDKIQAQIKVQDTMMLPRFIRNPNERNAGEQLSCKIYNYDECMYENLRMHMKAETEDNCTVPWILGNKKICKKPRDIESAFWIHYNRSTNQKEDCATKCHMISANVLGKNFEKFGRNDSAMLYSYFSLDVEKRREQYLYDAYRLMAEVNNENLIYD